MGYWVGDVYHATVTAESIMRDEFGDGSLSAFQRRAAQVKRAAMLDEAVRRYLAPRYAVRKALRFGGHIRIGQKLIDDIRAEFALLERESRSVRAAPPLVETATQPAGAS